MTIYFLDLIEACGSKVPRLEAGATTAILLLLSRKGVTTWEEIKAEYVYFYYPTTMRFCIEKLHTWGILGVTGNGVYFFKDQIVKNMDSSKRV